ncbi:hypothetical protein [Halopiger aswanensis]|nr:hypothetical protein [Halopiger aswanensis]
MSRDRNRDHNHDRRRDRNSSGANDSNRARGSSRRPRRRDRAGRRGAREQEERSADIAGRRRLGAGFVLLVGLSGGLMALQGDASLAAVGAVTVASMVAGGALLWYLYWIVR